MVKFLFAPIHFLISENWLELIVYAQVIITVRRRSKIIHMEIIRPNQRLGSRPLPWRLSALKTFLISL